ncbi:MAG TPA: FHA domain-containing protein, partial [Thermoanaerobaculia bacterium]
AVAVQLPSALARCSCGELLIGMREVLAARVAAGAEIDEVDLSPFRMEPSDETRVAPEEPPRPLRTRNVRVIARGRDAAVEKVFTVAEHPLLVGRRGAHVELDDAELSIRHFEIVVRGEQLYIRDCDSYTGTFLDGEPVSDAALSEGMHLVRAGSALICLEPTEAPGEPVGPIELPPEALREASPALMKKLFEAGARKVHQDAPRRRFLVAVEGPATGKEYEIPAAGLIVGREGDVRPPDEFLSRKHFSIIPDDEGHIRIKDLGSRNGTFLNTLPARNTRVQAGDQIRAGTSVFRIEER